MFCYELRCLNCYHRFPYLRFAHGPDGTVNCPACMSGDVGNIVTLWLDHTQSYDPGPYLENVTVEGCVVGIKVEGGMTLHGSNGLLRGNQIGIDADDLRLDVEGLTIE